MNHQIQNSVESEQKKRNDSCNLLITLVYIDLTIFENRQYYTDA